MSRLRVLVLMGGPSTEHDVSVVSGTGVVRAMDPEKYNIHPVLIDKDGTWHWSSRELSPSTISTASKARRQTRKSLRHLRNFRRQISRSSHCTANGAWGHRKCDHLSTTLVYILQQGVARAQSVHQSHSCNGDTAPPQGGSIPNEKCK